MASFSPSARSSPLISSRNCVGEHRFPYEVQGHAADEERFGKKAHGHTILFGLQILTVTTNRSTPAGRVSLSAVYAQADSLHRGYGGFGRTAAYRDGRG